jgi:hypothetical protein
VEKLLLLTSVFDGGLVKSTEITSSSRNHTTAEAYISPCTISSVKQLRNIHLLFWAVSTFIGLNMKHMPTKNICSIYIHQQKKKMPLAYRSNMTTPPCNSRFITKFIQTSNLNCIIVFHFPSQHSRFITYFIQK